LISASVVVSMFFGLSYLFAEQFIKTWEKIKRAELALTVTIVAAILGIVVYFYIRHRRRVDRIRLRRLRRTQRKPIFESNPPEGNGEWTEKRQQKLGSSQPSEPRA
jgi:uncharacterized membrane protein YbhN (UPF0104 family)